MLLIPIVSYAQTTTINGMSFEVCLDENGEDNGLCRLTQYSGDATELSVPDTVVIEEKKYTVSSIGSRAFWDNKNIQAVILPNSIKTLENGAFEGCTYLKSINLPYGLERIEPYVFYYCEYITTPVFPGTLKYIGESAYGSTSSIGNLSFPASVEYIGKGCFNRAYDVRSIIFEDGEKNLIIKDDCFECCYYLDNLYIGRNIIADKTSFYEFSDLSSLIVGSNVTDLSWIEPNEITNLVQIVCNAPNPPSIGKFSSQQYEGTLVYVPSEALSNYENNQTWAFFSSLFGLEKPYTEYEIAVNPSEVTINVGETAEVYADVDIYTYISMNVESADVIQIVDFEKIIGVSPGEADLTYTMLLNNKQAKCRVTVIQPATGIKLNKTELTLNIGESATILANVSPSNVSNPYVTWSSTNSSVATVDDGIVTSIGAGECDIIATTHNGITASCKVIVNPIVINSITLNPEIIEGKIGDEIQLNAFILPENATDKTLAWYSADEVVATVDDNGLVKIINDGTTTIHAKATDGSDVEGICQINCTSGINDILAGKGNWNIYNANGVLIKENVTSNEFRSLVPAVYILANGIRSVKIVKH